MIFIFYLLLFKMITSFFEALKLLQPQVLKERLLKSKPCAKRIPAKNLTQILPKRQFSDFQQAKSVSLVHFHH